MSQLDMAMPILFFFKRQLYPCFKSKIGLKTSLRNLLHCFDIFEYCLESLVMVREFFYIFRGFQELGKVREESK